MRFELDKLRPGRDCEENEKIGALAEATVWHSYIFIQRGGFLGHSGTFHQLHL